jgi:hypothetical protein
MNEHPKIKVIKRKDQSITPDKLDGYIDSHKRSLISLLVEQDPDSCVLELVRKHPQRINEFMHRLRESMKAAA